MEGATGTTTAMRCTPQAMSSCKTDSNIALLHPYSRKGRGRSEGVRERDMKGGRRGRKVDIDMRH